MLDSLTSNRKTFLLFTIILLVVATGLLVLYFFVSNRPEGYVDGMGIIDHIDSDYDVALKKWDYTYFVRYTYQGNELVNELRNYSGSFNVGDEIHILINSADPSMIQNLGTAEGNQSYLIGCYVIYGIAAVFGVLTVFSFIRKRD